MTAVEAAVARFARAKRHDLWPRFTARAAGVTTAQARDAMVKLAEDGLLDLWYVVICENGDEVSRTKHPEPAPIGQPATCDRCDVQAPFEVTAADVYLMFSPTERLRTLAGQEEDDPVPKVGGAGGPASAPSQADPDELARRAPQWAAEKGVLEIHLHQHNHYGYTIGGDVVRGDKVGRDKTGGDKVSGSEVVRGDNIGGDQTTVTTAPTAKKKTASAIVITAGMLFAIAIAVVFYRLADHHTLSVVLAVPVGAAATMATLAITNMIASHLRG